MTPQPDALPACPHGHKPDTGWFDYFSSHLVPKRFRIWIKGIPCQCDVSGPDEQSARAAWAALCAPHALASSRAEVERLRKLVAPTVGDGPLWDQKIPGPTDELRKRWDTEANHAFCMSSDIGDQAQFVKGYVAAKYRDWYWYEIICQREHRAALQAAMESTEPKGS